MMELDRVTSWIYWMLLSLVSVILLCSHLTLAEECSQMSGKYLTTVCHASTEFPEWCNCNKSTQIIDLQQNGFTDRLKRTSLLFFFSNSIEALPGRCYNENRICLCDADLSSGDSKKCSACQFGDVDNMVCLRVEGNNTIRIRDATSNPNTDCIFTEVCKEQCTNLCKNLGNTMNTFPPPIRPNRKTTTAAGIFSTNSMTDKSHGVDTVFIIAGIVVFTLIVVLSIVLIICCRKNKDVTKKKKEGPYEAVYSTIDDGSLQNGNVNIHMYPNQFYDAEIGRPPVPPSRPEVASHHKSMPSLHTMNYTQSAFQDTQYQPYLPHHQPIWKNRPTLHRYPSTDGYRIYGSDEQLSTGTYMYLKREQRHPYQTLPTQGTAELTPEDIERFRALTSNGRPGYSKTVAEDDNKVVTEDYTLLNRDPRSLPINGSSKEYEEQRKHATYGFERRYKSRTKSVDKPVPAKRGQYRSKGDAIEEETMVGNDQCSSDSDNEGYQGLGNEGSPYYFQMNTDTTRNDDNENITTENKGNQDITTENSTRPEKKKTSRKNPKPRTRRQRRRPTMEVTCEMVENPLASSSHDEGDVPSAEEYTDDDIEDGLKQLEKRDDNQKLEKVDGADFEDSDYYSPESIST